MKVKHLPLHEKFNDSMPKWLQNYFLHNNKKKPSKYEDPEYKGFKNARTRDVGRDEEIGPAIQVFTDKGLDLNRVNIISQSVPAAIDDPIFKDQGKMCLVHLRSDNDETVWVPNYSAPHERFTLNDGKVITLNHLNNKQYKQYAKDFAYIDLSDSNIFNKDLKRTRQNIHTGATAMERDPLRGKFVEKNPRDYMATKYDKSGYPRVPLVRKYAKKLAEYRLTKLPQRLLEVRDELATAFKNANSFKNDYLYGLDMDKKDDFTSVDMRQKKKAITEVDSYLNNAFDHLQEALSLIRFLPEPNSGGTIPTYTLDNIKLKFRMVDENINSAYNIMNAFLPKTIDWDPNDSSIFSDDDWDEYM